MNIHNNGVLKRARGPSEKGPKLNFEGKDLTRLLLMLPEALSKGNRLMLMQCYEERGKSFFEKFASDNQIVPFAAHVLMDLNCDKVFWKEKHDRFAQRNGEIKALLESMFLDAQSYSCKSITLTENFAVVLASNSCIGCFCSGDVDLSADLSEKENIVKWMESFDFFSKKQPNSIGEYSGQSMQFFNADVIGGGFWINVIWKPVTRAFLIQDKYEVRLAKDRVFAIPKRGSSIRILENTSLLYFCALHAAAGHYFTMQPGLRLFVDIDRLARCSDINWEHIAKWEREDEAGIRISTVMYLSFKLLNTPVPKEIYSSALQIKKNLNLINYLYNDETKEIQGKSNKLRRLYIELASDGKNIVTNFVIRVCKLLRSKF